MLVIWVDQEIPKREPRCEKARKSWLFVIIRKDHLETSNSMGEAFVMSMFTHRSAGVTTRAAIDELGRLVLTRGGW